MPISIRQGNGPLVVGTIFPTKQNAAKALSDGMFAMIAKQVPYGDNGDKVHCTVLVFDSMVDAITFRTKLFATDADIGSHELPFEPDKTHLNVEQGQLHTFSNDWKKALKPANTTKLLAEMVNKTFGMEIKESLHHSLSRRQNRSR